MPNRIRHALNATSLVLGIALTLTLAMVVGAFASGSSTGPVLNAFPRTGTGTQAVPFAHIPAAPPATPLTRVYQSSFGSFPFFGDPQALTVDQSTGDVYAVGPSAGTVSRYTSVGAPDNFTAGPNSGTNTLTEFGFDGPSAAEVAIAPAGAPGGTAGDIYVVSFAGVDIYANDGTHLGQIKEANGAPFAEACGVATDNTGKLYIGDFGGTVDRYVPSANPVTNADYDAQITEAESPCNIAADSTGAVYASKWSTGPLTKYTAADFGSSNPGTVIDATSRAVSVDPSTDDVYVDEGEKISVFDSTGTALYSFGSSTDFGTESAGVAVIGSGGNAYVADRTNNQIDVYGPPVPIPPTATTGSATDIHHVKAIVNGHLDPNGGAEVTDCHFDWGTTNTYGNTTPCAQGNDYVAAADVSATITGLEPGKTYHYRLSITNTAGTATGTDQTLETTAVPIVHELTSSFGASGSGDGQLSGNTGLAVNQSTGDVYVADTANHRVEKFDASGTFISAFGWGVKDGNNEAQTCTTGCQAGIPGSGAGQLDTPTFIAIDNSGGPSAGDIYVGDTTNNTVTKYDSTGNYIATNDGTASGTAFGPLAGIAVDTNGNLWAYDTNGDMREFAQNGTFTIKWNSGFGVTPAGVAVDSSEHPYIVRGTPVVEKLTPSGSDIGEVSGPEFTGPTTGFTVDQATGDLFIDDGGKTIRLYRGTCDPSTGHCTNTEAFGANSLNAASGVAINSTTGRVYVSDPHKIKIFDQVTPPDVTTGTATAPSATSATLNGIVGPNGVALTDCHFEYVTDAAFLATAFTDLSTGGTAPCTPNAGSISTDFEDHAVTATITNLDPTNLYHYRLVATNAQATASGQPVVIPGPALVETTGSPTRTITTARLDSRLDPRGAPANYHFEYGDQGSCDSNPCTSTPTKSAGNGDTFKLVSQRLTNLQANTTYHYRIVADNGISGGTAYGHDVAVRTRASDAPLAHGHFPGPPGSDRAWEQVNVPDTSGNTVERSLATSSDGDRVLYSIDGGSPGSQNGGGILTPGNDQLAERTVSGWHTSLVYPTRARATGNQWTIPKVSDDLSQIYDINKDVTAAGDAGTWHMSPGHPAQNLSEVPYNDQQDYLAAAADGSRVITVLEGNHDPEHPVGPSIQELYDVTTGTAHLVGLMPDGSVPSCGVRAANYPIPIDPSEDWVSPDGANVFFLAGCNGFDLGLYVRNFKDSTTTQIVAQQVNFLHATRTAVFFTTDVSLDPGDAGGTDVYRYDLGNGEYDCITCLPDDAGKIAGKTNTDIAVSEDGSRVYFKASARLLPGAPTEGIYRVNVASHELVYVAPGGSPVFGRASAGLHSTLGNAISPDGSVFVFRSNDPNLNAVDGQQNGEMDQYYRYDDRDHSLVCASCPDNGSAPFAQVSERVAGEEYGPNETPLDAAGDFAFTTATPLVLADQNTARSGQNPSRGDDLYEWRDGRLLLVTDGTSDASRPQSGGFGRDGRDLFFFQNARLTPDALDSNRRLYDARIGGGFDFPQPPPACSLDACQGNPVAPPLDSTPSSASFTGSSSQGRGSVTATARTKATNNAKCKKGKKGSKCKVPAKCMKGKKGRKCRKARHANTIRRIGR